MDSAWLQGWMFFSASREMTSHPSLHSGVCLQPSILKPSMAAPFGLVWLNVRWTKGNESWAEGKERRAAILYFTLFSPCMALSLSSPLTSIFTVFCKVWKCIFSGFGSLQCFSVSREKKGEGYWKDIIQGPEIPFFRLFCGSFRTSMP